MAVDAADGGESEGVMARAWLGKDRAIPRCVIVDRDTKVAWIGHPMEVDGPLRAVVAGTFDAAKQAEIEKKLLELNRQFALAMKDKQWRKVPEILDQIHAVDPFITPTYHPYRIKAWIALGDYSAAHKFVKDVAIESDDLRLMGKLVGELLKAPDQSQLDLDFVLATAKRAARNGESDDPFALSALARASEAKEDYAGAIKAWTKMLELDDGLVVRESVKARLEELRMKQSNKK